MAGGSATLAAEKTAQYLSAQYNDGKTAIDPNTGEFNPNLLPENVKEEIRSITGSIASVGGATGDGGAAFNAQVAGVIGQNSVENNSILGDKFREWIDQGKQYFRTEKDAKDNLDVARNAAVEILAGAVDGSVGTVDYGIDSLNAVVYCLGLTPTYCRQANATLDPKNRAVVDVALSTLDKETYQNLLSTVKDAAGGDLEARETVAVFLGSMIKKKPNSGILKSYIAKSNSAPIIIPKVEQILPRVHTWEQARNLAIKNVGNLGMDSKPVVGRLEISSGHGKIIGRQSADGKKGWRLDYDPEKGTHINTWDFTQGKGPGKAIKQVIPFNGNEKDFQIILKQLNR